MNLDEYLAALSDLDRAAEMDPQEISDTIEGLKNKIDAIYKVRDRLEMESKRLTKDAALLLKSADAVERHHKRLTDYVCRTMVNHEFEQVPGRLWRVAVQNSPMSLVTDRDPGPEDMLETPQYVRRKVFYSWEKDLIKDRLLAGEKFKDMKLIQGKHIRFYPNKGVADE